MKKLLMVAVLSFIFCIALAVQAQAHDHARTGGGQQIQVSFDRARDIALERVGGGRVRNIELERERGLNFWDVEVRYRRRKHEIKIDASSGEILGHEIGRRLF